MSQHSPEQFLPKKQEGAEKNNFHFEQIAELEPAAISLVEKLKENIERGKYNTLVSDEVGGRIPTLILRKIIKKINPDARLETYFLSSGQKFFDVSDEKYKKLLEYTRENIRNTKNALIVTEFIFKGGTVSGLYRILKQAGVQNVDIAALRYAFLERINFPSENLYTGSRGKSHSIDEEHYNFFGVRKSKSDFSPHPLHITKVIEKEGRELSLQDYREIFEIGELEPPQEAIKKSKDPEKNAEWERRVRAPLTQEEKESIQRDIGFARQDIELLAERVIEKIWGAGTKRQKEMAV